MPTEFISRAGDRRFGDVLWVANLRDGRQVMVMIEIQSDVDMDMAARMAAYVGMVYESLTPAARGTTGRYPAIFPLVVHTGNSEWNAADNLRDLADPVPGLAGHIVGPRYVRLDLGALQREDLRNDRLSVLAQLSDGRPLAHKVVALRKAEEWLRDGDAEDRSLFGAYQDWVRVLLPQLKLPVPDPDTEVVLEWRDLMDGMTELEARAREWPQEWLQQGREEGLEKGREEGQLALLSRQASRRCGPHRCILGVATADALVAELTGSDHVRLEAVADLILDCETGTELLDRVNGEHGP